MKEIEQIASHPGWCVGGTVKRQNLTYLILDSGRYGQDKTWSFYAKRLCDGSYAIIWPISIDIYQPKESDMISRNWIVVSSLNGPSPTKHPTVESAIEEAKRLALKNPSAQFLVYELCKAFQVESVKEIEVGDIPF